MIHIPFNLIDAFPGFIPEPRRDHVGIGAAIRSTIIRKFFLQYAAFCYAKSSSIIDSWQLSCLRPHPYAQHYPHHQPQAPPFRFPCGHDVFSSSRSFWY